MMMQLLPTEAADVVRERNFFASLTGQFGLMGRKSVFKAEVGWLFAAYIVMPFRGAIVRHERNGQ
jgi:hypothetical protein